MALRSPRRCQPYQLPTHGLQTRCSCPLVCGSGWGSPSPFPSFGEGRSSSFLAEGRTAAKLSSLAFWAPPGLRSGTEACPALLQATARRCRSAGVTRRRSEKLCWQPPSPLGKRNAAIASTQRWPGGRQREACGRGMLPPMPLPPCPPPGGGTAKTPSDRLMAEGAPRITYPPGRCGRAPSVLGEGGHPAQH